MTPREQRRAERAQRKADRERRKKEAQERSAERSRSDRELRAKTAASMTARERAAGLHLTAFGFGGEKTPQPKPQEKPKKMSAEEVLKQKITETANSLEVIKQEMIR